MTGFEKEVATHPAMVIWIVGVLVGLVGAMGTILWRLVWPKIDSTNSVSLEHCEQCKEAHSLELEAHRRAIETMLGDTAEAINKRLASGDAEFTKNRKVLFSTLLFVKALCVETLGDQTICKELDRVLVELGG